MASLCRVPEHYMKQEEIRDGIFYHKKLDRCRQGDVLEEFRRQQPSFRQEHKLQCKLSHGIYTVRPKIDGNRDFSCQ